MLRWLLVVVLIGGFCWFANLTAFNWWAAGGPPTPHPEYFAGRGNLFAIVACLLLIAAIVLSVTNVRRMRASRG